MECAVLPSLQERLDCIRSCSCKCNSICIDNCKEIGLDSVCQSSCGCPFNSEHDEETKEVNDHTDHHEEHEDEEKDEDKEKEDKEERKDFSSKEDKEVELVENNIITKLISESSTTELVSPENTLEDLAIKTVLIGSNTPFEKVMSGMMEKGEQCEPTWWRPCLHKMEDKSKALTWVQKCKWGEDSLQLLAAHNEIAKLPVKSHSGSLILLICVITFAIMIGGILITWKKKEEKENSEVQAVGEYENEGYVKLI